MTGRSCLKCGEPLAEQVRGRPSIYCGPVCRRAAEFELRRVQNALVVAETEMEEARRRIEMREAGLASGGGTATPRLERLGLEQAGRRVGELESRLHKLLGEQQ